MSKDISGLVTAITTPFTDKDKIDIDSYIAHLEFMWKNGADRILVNGTTGEFHSLLKNEQRLLLKVARQNFKGILIYHAGCDCLKQTIIDAKYAEDNGADAIACLTPYYLANVPEDGLIGYFKKISESIKIPFLLYNFPKHTGNNITEKVLKEVAHYGLKDSSRNMNLISKTPIYFVGGDTKITETYKNGGRGFISGRSNFAPKLFVDMEKAQLSKDQQKIAKLQEIINKISAAFSGQNQISLIKYAVSKKISSYKTKVRLPLLEITNDEKKVMDVFLSNLDTDYKKL